MMNDVIPDSNHVSRYCKPFMVVNGEPQPAAFHLREDEEYLSVDWLEFLEEVKGRCDFTAITEALADRRFKASKRGKHAVFNVGELIEYVKDKAPDNRKLEALHVPRNKKDPHSGVYNFNHEENNMFGVLIAQAIKEILKTQ